MPKSSKTSSHKVENNPSQDEASTHDESSSDKKMVKCVIQEAKEETSKWECQANLISIDDKSCQSTKSTKSILHSDKNCQSSKSVCDNKNCQSIKKYSSEECPLRPVCNDKSCLFAKPMCYVRSEETQSSHMQSVPKTACKQIETQPEVTRNKVCTVLPTNDHFLFVNKLCVNILQARVVTHLQLQKCFQFQESTINNLTIVILEVPRCNLHRRGQLNPGNMESNHMWPVQAEFQNKSQVNTKLQVQTSK